MWRNFPLRGWPRGEPMAPSGQVLLPTEGTDVNAHPTGPDSGDLISQIVSILFAAVDVKAGLAMFLRIEGAARKSPRRTGFDAELAIGTPVGERPARFKRGVSQVGYSEESHPHAASPKFQSPLQG